MNKTIIKILRIGGVFSLIIVMVGVIIINGLKIQRNYKNSQIECYGIIEKVKIDSSDHGTPYFLINNEWKYLGAYGRPLARRLGQIGDSIAKNKEDSRLLLYRKNKHGNYILKHQVDEN